MNAKFCQAYPASKVTYGHFADASLVLTEGHCRILSENGYHYEAYSRLVRNQKAKDHALKAIAEKHAVITAQVLIRYSLQKDWVPLPKSDTLSRIAENADVYAFELTKEETGKLDELDEESQGSIRFAVSNTL